MNEAIRIAIVVDGQAAPATGMSTDGIILQGESSASRRGLSLILNPVGFNTEFRLRRVRQVQDWQPGEFKMRVGMEAGRLLCQGEDSRSLPFGRYRLRVQISDLKPVAQPVDINVPEDGLLDLELKFKSDPRRIVLHTPIGDFDEKIRAVIARPESILDALPVAEWLSSDKPRARRKACLLNLLAKLRATEGHTPNSFLIDGVVSVFLADVDRLYAAVQSDFYRELTDLANDESQPFYFEGEAKHPTHKRLRDKIGELGLEPDAQSFSLMSFRQEGKASMQAVVAVPPGGDPNRPHYVDLDIDLGNPLQDVEGFLIHFGEILAPGKTDHFGLAKKLAGGPTSEFMYYDVTK